MKRDAIDFHDVEPGHVLMHGRLENWARWANGRPSTASQPMFRLYRPDAWDRELGGACLDPLDAQRLQKAVVGLPERHRAAVSWCYLSAHNPRAAAQRLGESMSGLRDLIRAGRQMLVARRV